MDGRSVIIAGVAAAIIAALLIVVYFVRWLRLHETKRRMGECLAQYFNGDLPLDRLAQLTARDREPTLHGKPRVPSPRPVVV